MALPSSPWRLALTLCIATSAGSDTARAQQMPPAPPCPPAEAHAFDFMLGDWIGTVYTLNGSDSTRGPTAHVSNAKILAGCALEEHWHFEEHGATEVDALILRAFDAATGEWSYNLATNRNEHLTYEGQKDGDVWRFYYDLTADGTTTRIRITWVPTPAGYSEQIARSSDGGHSWALTRHVNFVRQH
jgi:hypothetical protein